MEVKKIEVAGSLEGRNGLIAEVRAFREPGALVSPNVIGELAPGNGIFSSQVSSRELCVNPVLALAVFELLHPEASVLDMYDDVLHGADCLVAQHPTSLPFRLGSGLAMLLPFSSEALGSRVSLATVQGELKAVKSIDSLEGWIELSQHSTSAPRLHQGNLDVGGGVLVNFGHEIFRRGPQGYRTSALQINRLEGLGIVSRD